MGLLRAVIWVLPTALAVIAWIAVIYLSIPWLVFAYILRAEDRPEKARSPRAQDTIGGPRGKRPPATRAAFRTRGPPSSFHHGGTETPRSQRKPDAL